MPKSSKNGRNERLLPTTPPKHLGRIASAQWRKMVPILNSSDKTLKVDANLLEMYCSQYEIYRQALDHIQKNGNVVAIYKTSLSPVTGEVAAKDFQGYKRNPSTLIYSDAVAKLTKLGSELGFSPKSRAELMQIEEIPNTDDGGNAGDKIKEFFG